MGYIDDLMAYGLTRQEAYLYQVLLEEDLMTGYEAAKQTGISRSNTYTALAALVDKGAAYLAEGTPTRYKAVEIDAFCRNKIEYLEKLHVRLIENRPVRSKDEDVYLTISGSQNIIQKINRMIEHTQLRVYMTGTADWILLFSDQLKTLTERGIKTVLITDRMVSIPFTQVYLSDEPMGNQIGVIVDSSQVLTGDYSEYQNCACLFSCRKNLIDLFKQSMRRQIQLIDLKNYDKKEQ